VVLPSNSTTKDADTDRSAHLTEALNSACYEFLGNRVIKHQIAANRSRIVGLDLG
jgi:hypothetical protein